MTRFVIVAKIYVSHNQCLNATGVEHIYLKLQSL